MLPNQRIYLTETRSGRLNAVLETTESVVVQNIDQAVTKVLSAYPRVYWLSKADGIAVGYQGENVFYFAKLPALHFRTTYQVIPGDKVTPTWGLQERPGLPAQVNSDQVWKTPSFMSLWLIHAFGNADNPASWYLIASLRALDHDPDEKNDSDIAFEFRKLPVGNQHTDARMCMGNEFPRAMENVVHMSNPPPLLYYKVDSVLSFLAATKSYLNDSLWNADLCTTEQRQKSEQLFQWDLSAMSQVKKSLAEVRDNSWTTSGPFDECLLALERGDL